MKLYDQELLPHGWTNPTKHSGCHLDIWEMLFKYMVFKKTEVQKILFNEFALKSFTGPVSR